MPLALLISTHNGAQTVAIELKDSIHVIPLRLRSLTVPIGPEATYLLDFRPSAKCTEARVRIKNFD